MEFFKKDKKIQELMEQNNKLHTLIELNKKKIDRLEEEITSLRKRPPILIDIVNDVDSDYLPKSYLPTKIEERKAFLAEITRLNDNKYLNKLINYSINYVAANIVLNNLEESRGKFIIEGIRTIKEQLLSGNKKFLEILEEEKPISDEEQEELINTSITEVLNKQQ